MTTLDRRLCVAPMMDWTDRHCRYFLRGFSAYLLLYTEMITAHALLRGDRTHLLAFDPEEHPIALQLGGSDPQLLARAAQLGEAAGFDEINLNCGCPSDRVAGGAFGACLMLDAEHVASIVAAMKQAVRIPVTVKIRIGVVPDTATVTEQQIREFSEQDFQLLQAFVDKIITAGCDAIIVHARKAVLGKLSPKENRTVPLLHYDVVARLKKAVPTTPVIVNGGLRTLAQCQEMLQWSEGVMLGREAYHRPEVLSEISRVLFPKHPSLNRSPANQLERMAHYAARQLQQGVRLPHITRHMLGLYNGHPGAKEYRRLLSEAARAPQANAQLLLDARNIVGNVLI
jgi:tRNA-dihydrouridine synthase A